MGAVVLVASFVVVVIGVLVAWVADWRRSRLRKPGRVETPFGLPEVPSYDVEALRAATSRGRRRSA